VKQRFVPPHTIFLGGIAIYEYLSIALQSLNVEKL